MTTNGLLSDLSLEAVPEADGGLRGDGAFVVRKVVLVEVGRTEELLPELYARAEVWPSKAASAPMLVKVDAAGSFLGSPWPPPPVGANWNPPTPMPPKGCKPEVAAWSVEDVGDGVLAHLGLGTEDERSRCRREFRRRSETVKLSV